ncbi:MAG: helix-turn-helix domain-containing protein [Clostridia bacterium]|nr:helix-turn-helix domain-containing protein [Clostridia bacterium]
MHENICNFVPFRTEPFALRTVHFVLETQKHPFGPLKSEALYKMHIVNSGHGILHTMGKSQKLSKGDIFFTFPSFPYCIESTDNFSYMYVAFLGERGNQLLGKLNISRSNFLFPGYQDIISVWRSALSIHPEICDISSESILLYTFSVIGNKTLTFSQNASHRSDTALHIKKYVDDNFSDCDFSLERISKELSYNKKYISAVFKKTYGVDIVSYVNTVRIQHALNLMKQGFTSINDIAFCCGYKDPQYFSKIFKEKTSMPPVSYIKEKVCD